MKITIEKFPNFYQHYQWSPEVEDKTFVGRKIELEQFWRELYNLTNYHTRQNAAFIGQRKLGKTAFLIRCYNIAFWEQEEVIPFYYCFPQNDKLQVSTLAKEIAFIFLKQAISFITKDEKIIRMKREEVLFHYLTKYSYPWLEELKMYWDIIKKEIEELQQEWKLDSVWGLVDCFSSVYNKKCLLIVDEAQQMECALYNGDKLTPAKGTLAKTVNNSQILTFISGSQVSMIAYDFLSLPMGNRVSTEPFAPLEQEDAYQLIQEMVGKNGYKDIEKDIYQLVGGNPYYIRTLLSYNAKYSYHKKKQKKFANFEEVKEIYNFEVLHPQGKIYKFWQTHFLNNAKLLNGDPKGRKGLTFRILRFIAEEQRKISFQEIREKFNIKNVEQKMLQLRDADLIENPPFTQEVYGLQDRVLAVVITRMHQKMFLDDTSPEKLEKEVERLLSPYLQNKIEKLEQEQKKVSKRVKSVSGQVNRLQGGIFEKKVKKGLREGHELLNGYKIKGDIDKLIIGEPGNKEFEVDLFAMLQDIKANGNKKIAMAVEVKDRKSKVYKTMVRTVL